MAETIRLGDIVIAVTRKDVKHVHLSVYPPRGRVTLVAPANTRLEVARAYAISKLSWIRSQRTKLRAQARETPRRRSGVPVKPTNMALSSHRFICRFMSPPWVR